MTDLERRIEEGRALLRERWGEKVRATPSLADEKPLGSGPRNRHGMPQVPPEQGVLSSWPVLEFGEQPVVPLDRWELRVEGEVEGADRTRRSAAADARAGGCVAPGRRESVEAAPQAPP